MIAAAPLALLALVMLGLLTLAAGHGAAVPRTNDYLRAS